MACPRGLMATTGGPGGGSWMGSGEVVKTFRADQVMHRL